jgi:5-methylthioadenosine/S-adenosylhomocysteine deaminase
MLEMRQAALLAKLAAGDPGALTGEKALEMATIDGARALGMDDEIGSLEVGKKADLVLFDTEAPHWQPRHLLPATIVYQAHSAPRGSNWNTAAITRKTSLISA